jgi:hypothetical protein
MVGAGGVSTSDVRDGPTGGPGIAPDATEVRTESVVAIPAMDRSLVQAVLSRPVPSARSRAPRVWARVFTAASRLESADNGCYVRKRVGVASLRGPATADGD